MISRSAAIASSAADVLVKSKATEVTAEEVGVTRYVALFVPPSACVDARGETRAHGVTIEAINRWALPRISREALAEMIGTTSPSIRHAAQRLSQLLLHFRHVSTERRSRSIPQKSQTQTPPSSASCRTAGQVEEACGCGCVDACCISQHARRRWSGAQRGLTGRVRTCCTAIANADREGGHESSDVGCTPKCGKARATAKNRHRAIHLQPDAPDVG